MASTVLITGASQGIGRATAWLFARQGYNVVLAARQPDRLHALATELQNSQHSALAIPTDTRDPQQVQALVQQALQQYGAIDVLVNNAGIYMSGPADCHTLEEWHQVIDTNLWGYIHTIHFILPHMIERHRGTIVNLASISGKVPVAYLVPYTTSKFALDGLTRSLHSEVAPKGVTVCGIYPNLIKSDFMERAIFRGKDDEDTKLRRQQVEQVLNVPVVEKPEDVAQAIWDAVQHKRTEVVVGSANLSLVSNRLFPDLVQWAIRRTFKNKDRDSGVG